MVKLLILMILVFVLYAVECYQIRHGKVSSQYTKSLSTLHIACGIIIAIFGTVHGIGHLGTLSTSSLFTGIAILILIYIEAITGIIIKKGQTSSFSKIFKKIHAILPILIMITILCHVAMGKLL